MTQPTAAMLVIGDEILSGRTREGNGHHLAGVLTEIGIRLIEVRVVPDVADEIVAAVQTLSAKADHVFTSGGIGPTHDDITAECVAAAFDTPISVRDDAREILARHYAETGRELNEARLRMARIPDGAELILNPVSAAPGFKIGNVHVMAGVPSVFQAMVQQIRPGLKGGAKVLSWSLRCEIGEGDLAGPLGEVQGMFPEVSMGSYPFVTSSSIGSVLVLRHADRGLLQDAAQALRNILAPMGGVASEVLPEDA
ncbi:MAG: molybdopterin-binding protein [Pseudomonadota bacterium]